MSRQTLSTEKIFPEALKQMENYHADVVKEVIDAVSKDRVVVVGMSVNPFVSKARKALDQHGVKFTYLEYGSYLSGWKKRLAIKLWSGWTTFPQVFSEGKLIGGYTDLAKVLKAGQLKP